MRSDNLRLLVFSRPTDPAAIEIQGRLPELMAAVEDGEDHSAPSAVPPALHRASLALLDLVEQIEQATGRRAGAVALYRSDREVGCACIGGGEPDVWSRDRPFGPPWLPITMEDVDAASALARARAFSLFARADLDLRLQWPFQIGAAKPEGVIVDAVWRVPEGFDVTLRPFGRGDRADSGRDGRAMGDAGQETESFFAGWFDDLYSPVALEGQHPTAPARPIPPATAIDDEAIEAAPGAAGPLPRIVDELRAFIEAEAAEDAADEPIAAAEPTDEWPAEAAEIPSEVSAHRSPLEESMETAEAMGPTIELDEPESVTPAEPVFATPDAGPARPRAAAPAARVIRRPQWPRFSPPKLDVPWRAHAPWIAVMLVLFAVGWWVGTRAKDPAGPTGRSPAALRLLRSVGLAAARYTVDVNSTPPGAIISVDGKPTRLRTPAEVDLTPGQHRVSISFPELGETTHWVTGGNNQRVRLDVPLAGSLNVLAPDIATPIAVTVDGEARGYAPVRIGELAPGAHDLEFTAAGQPPWAQTVRVPVRAEVAITARPFDLPAMGLIEVVSTILDDEGTQDLKGAVVWVDGERRGTTPINLDLPRGPHSLRAEYRGEEAPVQLIDLPGGNRRFSTFAFGTGVSVPRLVLQSPRGPVSKDVATPVSVSLSGASASDVREMWLHVGAQNGVWKRYSMTVLAGETGAVGVVVFPSALLDDRGRAPFYVSALMAAGEECFTELANAGAKPPPATRSAATEP